MRTVLPHSLHTVGEQDLSMKKRALETEAFCTSTQIDFTDGGRNADDRKHMSFSDDTISD